MPARPTPLIGTGLGGGVAGAIQSDSFFLNPCLVQQLASAPALSSAAGAERRATGWCGLAQASIPARRRRSPWPEQPLFHIPVAELELKAQQHTGSQLGQGVAVRALGMGIAGQGQVVSDSGTGDVAALSGVHTTSPKMAYIDDLPSLNRNGLMFATEQV